MKKTKKKGLEKEHHVGNESPDPLFIIIDLFCGAGGVTSGFAQAELPTDKYSKYYVGPDYCKTGFNKICKVVACINHDHKAIMSHWANHKEVKHFEEDIRALDLTELSELVKHYRKRYPNAYIILWASLECTNFSKAKGGLAREEDSRTLAKTLNMKWNESIKEYEIGDSYIQLLDPDFVMIENVVEFKDWGPSRVKMKDGKPVMIKNKHGEWVEGYEDIPEFRGQEFNAWCNDVCSLGYSQEWTQMNSADYGAYTSRNRLFGVFAKDQSNIVFPSPTHAKGGKNGLKKWNAVKHKLDFSDEGYSIFHRSRNLDIPKRQRKDLVDNTLERIYAGCIKHIAGGKAAFLAKYHGGAPRTHSIENPLPVIDTQNRHSLINTSFISKKYSGKPDGKNISVDGPNGTITTFGGGELVQAQPFIAKHYGGDPEGKSSSIDQPAGALTTHPQQALVTPQPASFITQRNGGDPESKNIDVEGPARTLTGTGGNQDLVQAEFISVYHGNGDNTFPVTEPAPTIAAADINALIQAVPGSFLNKKYSGPENTQSTDAPAGALLKKDTHALVQMSFIDRPFTDGGGKNSSVEDPIGTIMPVPKVNLIQAEHMIDTTQYTNVPSSIEEPGSTITANRKYPYLLSFQYKQAQMQGVERPAPVILASSGKTPQHLFIVETGEAAIMVYETDSEIVVKLKEFMALYGIVDIKMRMLRVDELLRIQGFPDDYQLFGTQEDQKKFIGNSVVPEVPKAWAEAMGEWLIDKLKTKVA